MNNPDTEPISPLEPPESVYMLRGGAIYGEPVASDSDVFRTLEEALDEWLRRRSDWTGRFPLWGDMNSSDDTVIVHGTEQDTFEQFTLVQAFRHAGRDLQDLYLYLEPDQIAMVPLSDEWVSFDHSVVEALESLNPSELALIRATFPENIVWREDGNLIDTSAMNVNRAWIFEVAEAIQDIGSIKWVEMRPYRVGLEALDYQTKADPNSQV